MRTFSYVVARDYGFAPNPFHGFCTIATCKPEIRRLANVDDWVIGTGSKSLSNESRLVFAMRVTETLSFDDYWADQRFAAKRPNLRGSLKQAFGDNIYHRSPSTGLWLQENSHHSYANGEPNQRNIDHDTKAPRVLVSTDFVYWGGEGPKLPDRFRNFDGFDICAGRGYKSKFPEALTEHIVSWIRSLEATGYVGSPLAWS